VRIIIECPERILHLEAGYIYADCLFDNFKPLAVRRRTIHYQQLTANHGNGGRPDATLSSSEAVSRNAPPCPFWREAVRDLALSDRASTQSAR
jgi:hypothetical protein